LMYCAPTDQYYRYSHPNLYSTVKQKYSNIVYITEKYISQDVNYLRGERLP
jgi:hypothetical protein